MLFRLPQNLDVPDADEVETAEAKGWFSRIFSRSAKKDTKDVEMDDKSDEECERNSKNKQGWCRRYIYYTVPLP